MNRPQAQQNNDSRRVCLLGKDWLGRKLYARKGDIDKAILYKEIKNLQPDDIIDYFKLLSEEKIESLMKSISVFRYLKHTIKLCCKINKMSNRL
jgi:hypothetical protein